jgi:hypothetical protein
VCVRPCVPGAVRALLAIESPYLDDWHAKSARASTRSADPRAAQSRWTEDLAILSALSPALDATKPSSNFKNMYILL